MKQFATIITGVGFVLSAVFTSCSDMLDALPSQQKVDDNLIVDQKSAEQALNGVYYMYAECGTDYYDVLSTKCAHNQETLPGMFAGTMDFYQPGLGYVTHAILPDDSAVKDLWEKCYSQLSAANGVIEQMNKAPDAWFSGNRKKEIIAEARCMRALVHYQLLRWFAYYWDIDSPYGVLLRTSTVKAGSISKDRSTVRESYDNILSDLDYAIENIAGENPVYYANVWTAKALKARVLMMRGQQGDYAGAAALCGDIIRNGAYSLEDHVQDIFYQKGLDSKEVIFGIQPKEGQTNVFESYYYRQVPQYVPSEKLDSLFTLIPGDPRKDWLFTQVPNPMGSAGTLTLITKHINGKTLASDLTEESQYQIRLTEIYLLRAEALVRSGGDRTEAKQLLETVLEHAGVSDFTRIEKAGTDDALLREIFYEMLRNLFGESGRELEIMMRMPEEAVYDFNPAYKNKEHDVLPIPHNEFIYNKALKSQNPGYAR